MPLTAPTTLARTIFSVRNGAVSCRGPDIQGELSMGKKSTRLVAAFAVAASSLGLAGVAGADGAPTPNSFWWPDHLDLSPLRQHAIESDPRGAGFDYAKE